MKNNIEKIKEYLGESADELLTHTCKTIASDQLTLPGPDYLDKVFGNSDRNVQVLKSLASIHDHGRLGGTGYL